MTAFDDALKIVLHHEGGYVWNKHDPGGETNLGVTRKAWTEWSGDAKADMRALTPAKVKPLYKRRYWDAVLGDMLPPALALCVFDFAVNAGPARSAKLLQSTVGAVPDGKPGPRTLNAVQAFIAAHGLPQLVRQFQNARRDYYRALTHFPHFGRGWLRRCDAVETAALKLCR